MCLYVSAVLVHAHGFKNQVYLKYWVGAEEAKMSKAWSLQQDTDRDMQLKNDVMKYHRHSEGHTYPGPVCVTDVCISSSFCTYLAMSSENSGAERTISRITIPSFFSFFLLQGKKLGCLEVTPVFVWLTGWGQWGGKYRRNHCFNSLSTSFRCCNDNAPLGGKEICFLSGFSPLCGTFGVTASLEKLNRPLYSWI